MEPEKKSDGAFIGITIIIIILIVGGIYIWLSNKDALKKIQNESGNITEKDSADLSTLEMDAKATDTSTGVDPNSIQ